MIFKQAPGGGEEEGEKEGDEGWGIRATTLGKIAFALACLVALASLLAGYYLPVTQRDIGGFVRPLHPLHS